MFHFYSLFYYIPFHSITFHFIPYLVVREIYEVQCVLSYGVSFTIHYTRRASGTHSVLHLRSNLTFGAILPRILEQVPCPRCSTFILFFITFHFIPYIDVREIYRLFTVTFLSFLG